ncbi:MAG: hypothetical protein EON88_34270 [Brevundimonas sp.]|nr:MAG: hypothetical protein EON88_34270 [Brevundimonas sp.]
MQRLSAGVVSGLEETTEVTGLVADLEQAGRRIEKVVDAIALLAIQTTMLAVSGSVEAARAGEGGRGFSIVSRDIRNLAKDASDRAEAIKDVIRAIQVQIIASRRDLELITASAAGEIARNRLIDDRLATVETDMAAIRDRSGEIAQGAAVILSTVSEVLAGTGQISAAAEEAASAATQAAAAARQQAQSAEDLAIAIEEIASLADALKAGTA